MVDPTFLAIGAVTFLVVLILILRNGAKEEPKKPSKKDKKQQQLQAKQVKPKKGRSALKKNERAGLPSEWHVVGDSAAKDASEVLEFLKGKDPNEIAKQQGVATKAPTKKKGSNKKAKDEVHSSEDSATDDGSYEGFEEVKKKAPTDKKKKKKEKKEETKEHVSKPYFRLLNPDGTPVKDEKSKREKKPRKSEGDVPQAEGPQKEGEKREKRPKPDGEKREPRERKEGEPEKNRDRPPREPREPREPKEQRRPVTSAPNVLQEEQKGLDEILSAITLDFQQKPAPKKTTPPPKKTTPPPKKTTPPPKKSTPRETSIFSKLDRTTILKILAFLSLRDVCAVACVNLQLRSATRAYLPYKELVKKKRKTKPGDATAPQGEEKDAKGKKNEQASKEVVQE